jgi:protein-S-isoprenylcysteine O-methyltransferase Ste14
LSLYLRAAFWALLLPGVVTALVPWRAMRSEMGRFDPGALRWAGLLPMAVGAWALVWCVVDFARRGRGTLAASEAPTVLVEQGLYRWVRNPMYLSVLTILAGETLVFRSWLIAVWAAAMVPLFVLQVRFSEEPRLRRRFGAAYEAYCSRVGAWLPRRPH